MSYIRKIYMNHFARRKRNTRRKRINTYSNKSMDHTGGYRKRKTTRRHWY